MMVKMAFNNNKGAEMEGSRSLRMNAKCDVCHESRMCMSMNEMSNFAERHKECNVVRPQGCPNKREGENSILVNERVTSNMKLSQLSNKNESLAPESSQLPSSLPMPMESPAPVPMPIAPAPFCSIATKRSADSINNPLANQSKKRQKTKNTAATVAAVAAAAATAAAVVSSASLSSQQQQEQQQQQQLKLKFKTFSDPMPLAMPEDGKWLIPLHCFVRVHIVNIFCTTEEDVKSRTRHGIKVEAGQVGICCHYCRSKLFPLCPKGSIYFPSSTESIYNATMNLLQRHIEGCETMPDDIRVEYNRLKSDQARSGYSKKYWIDSAKRMGLVDTAEGIRYSPSARVTTSIELSSSHQRKDENKESRLVTLQERETGTDYMYNLMLQVEKCTFNESDRVGKRNSCRIGYPGLACKHCGSGCGLGRFFPSTFKTFCDMSKTLDSINKHIIQCRDCPEDDKKLIIKLRKKQKTQKAKLKFGNVRAFFLSIWNRLHDINNVDISTKDEKSS